MDNQIKCEGTLDLGGFQLPCYVLEDGTRVLSGRKMQETLKIVDGNTSGTKLPQFLSTSTLKPFIFNNKDSAHFEPIICFKGKQQINGYEATVLTDICESILEARRSGVKLTERQNIVANQCEILLSAFARVGIIALIDEATGYQHEREHDELQKILKAYISEELLPWQKRFPDIYYKELFRLNKWDYSVKGIKQRPSVIGRWTNTLIYEQLPKGVLEELKRKTPVSEKGNKTVRYHQYLTTDMGEPNLTAQINQVVTVFQLSDNMEEMWRQFNRLKQRQQGQLSLPFEFDDNGHTIEPKEKSEEPKLSDLDQKLTKALNYNPKEDEKKDKGKNKNKNTDNDNNKGASE